MRHLWLTKGFDRLRSQYGTVGEYYTLKDQANEPTIGVSVDPTDQATEQKLKRLRKEYREYRNVRLYPLQLPILIRLFTSVVLPILLIDTKYMIQSTAGL